MRTTRAAVLAIRDEDFIRTARAKGVPPAGCSTAHVLRNALVPIVTMTGLQFGYLLGGAVVVEQIFSVPGIGRQVLLGMPAEGVRRRAEHRARHRRDVRAGQPASPTSSTA